MNHILNKLDVTMLNSDIIESNAMQQFFCNYEIDLSDAEIAAVVGNSKAPSNKKIVLLSLIADQTEDHELKDRLKEWIRLAKSGRSKNKLASLSKDLFNSRFVNFMTPFAKGDIVKMARSDQKHGILMQGGMIIPESNLQNHLRILDYSDVQFRVEWLGDDGKFYHEHVNPLSLDYYMTKVGDPDYDVLTEAAALVKGDASASLQTFQMACEEFAKGGKRK